MRYILDTSALLAYLANEEGAGKLHPLKDKLEIPFIALTELYYLTWQRQGKGAANHVHGLVKSWNFPILMPDERIMLGAGRLKVKHHLGIADSFIAAFACERDATLVTKDTDFRAIDREIKILWI